MPFVWPSELLILRLGHTKRPRRPYQTLLDDGIDTTLSTPVSTYIRDGQSQSKKDESMAWTARVPTVPAVPIFPTYPTYPNIFPQSGPQKHAMDIYYLPTIVPPMVAPPIGHLDGKSVLHKY